LRQIRRFLRHPTHTGLNGHSVFRLRGALERWQRVSYPAEKMKVHKTAIRPYACTPLHMTSLTLPSIEATRAGESNTSCLDRHWRGSSLETSTLIGSQPLVFVTRLPPVKPVENGGEYKILVPTNGIDLRHFYVMATPDSLLIEVRIRNSFKHDGAEPVFSEVQTQRISRELRFRHPIQERGTIVQVRGGALQITCRKAATCEQKPWSEILHFDSRASLGSV